MIKKVRIIVNVKKKWRIGLIIFTNGRSNDSRLYYVTYLPARLYYDSRLYMCIRMYVYMYVSSFREKEIYIYIDMYI